MSLLTAGDWLGCFSTLIDVDICGLGRVVRDIHQHVLPFKRELLTTSKESADLTFSDFKAVKQLVHDYLS